MFLIDLHDFFLFYSSDASLHYAKPTPEMKIIGCSKLRCKHPIGLKFYMPQRFIVCDM
jgi:hypothetical protein